MPLSHPRDKTLKTQTITTQIKLSQKRDEKLSSHNGRLVYRDLVDFNLALLAKQSWRILQNSNAMWVHILKGSYFPDPDFLDAELGSQPSWLWSSLLDGRDSILCKARRLVLNGEQTNISLVN